MAYPVEMRDVGIDLVCAGRSVTEVAERLGVSRSALRYWLDQRGPMPAEITRMVHADGRGGLGPPPPDVPGSGPCRRALTSEDRAVIAAGLTEGLSYGRIGALIGRDKSVVCREVARNQGADGGYHPQLAHRAAAQRRRRPKPFKLCVNDVLCRRIEAWMDDGWSPGLISKVLAADALDGQTDTVSPETIYKALYVQTRGHLRADLHKRLSLKRRQRRTRGADRRIGGSPYAEAFTISQRPAEVADRAVPGHWEGDLIVGPESKSAIGTLVERSTRFVILLHLGERHDAATVAEAMIAEMSKLPDHLRRSITWDRGTELAAYERIQLDLGTTVYFCDPHSPWQRGSNENTNRLLRFWFEKGSDLSIHGPDDLQRVADTLNRRPRPTLDLQTPAQAMARLLTNKSTVATTA
jgi:IS30 family transposase